MRPSDLLARAKDGGSTGEGGRYTELITDCEEPGLPNHHEDEVSSTARGDRIVVSSSRARYLLLFAGVLRPSSRRSPWWLCWVSGRIAVASIPFLSQASGSASQWDMVFLFLFALSTVAAGSCFWWLPARASALALDRPLCPGEGAKFRVDAERISIGFMIACSVLGLLWNVINHAFNVSYFIVFNGTTPVLGALVLVLATEIADSLKMVHRILSKARDKTLDRTVYIDARDRIAARSEAWSCVLGVMSVAAFYSTVGFAYLMNQVDHDQVAQRTIAFSFVLLKHAGLLFAFLAIVTRVNDEADTLKGVLMQAAWGGEGEQPETMRLDLLWLASTYSVRPEALNSTWKYMMTPRVQPITFSIFGVRVTRDTVNTFTIVLMLALFGILRLPV